MERDIILDGLVHAEEFLTGSQTGLEHVVDEAWHMISRDKGRAEAVLDMVAAAIEDTENGGKREALRHLYRISGLLLGFSIDDKS